VQIAAGKLLLHPLAVALAFRLVGPPDPALKATGVIMASMPMVSIYPLLGQRYGLGDVCAAALMIATVLAVATTTVVIWLAAP
jgi:predicted permease